MKKIVIPIASALLAAALPVAALAAFAKGGTAYTKRVETPLLAEPSALSAPVTKIGYAKSLKIQEVKGPWLKVTDSSKSGWVFSGNLSEELPDDNKGVDGLPIAASTTTATAAARPFTPAATDYAARHGNNSAADDLKWLHDASDAVTTAKVDAALQEKKKGEFQ